MSYREQYPGIPVNQARLARLQNIPDEIQGLPYFYPKFGDSKTATKYVEQHSTGAGSFLVRLSSKGDNYLSLSVSIENNSVRHVNVVIERQPTIKYYIVEQVKFNSFQELRDYYKDHRICNLEQIANVKLLQPIVQGDYPADYARLDPVNDMPNGNASQAIAVPRRNSSNSSMPKTPSSHTLHPSFMYEQDVVGGVGRYVDPLAQLANGNGVRRIDTRRGGERPLPRVPKGGEPVVNSTQQTLRPPCPPPPGPGETEYYSRPRDETKDRLDELKKILKDSEVCDCGVPLCDSELPQGWTLHKSHDPATFGCLFYQSCQGDTTWNLPPQIVPEITLKQKKIIIKLSHQSGKAPPKLLCPPYQDEAGPLGMGQGHLAAAGPRGMGRGAEGDSQWSTPNSMYVRDRADSGEG